MEHCGVEAEKPPETNRLLADEFVYDSFHRAKPVNEENQRFSEWSTAELNRKNPSFPNGALRSQTGKTPKFSE